MSDSKQAVRRLIDDVINAGRIELIDELYAPEMAWVAQRWIEPFRAAFPDVHMETIELVAEGERVVGRFRCSGTHLGTWRGQEASGRRFEGVDEVYFFTVRDGLIAEAWGLEDSAKRLRQLGLEDR